MTEEEARQLIVRLLGTDQINLRPFEFGWVARMILSDRQRAQGMHVGQGFYIIDRTGVVTAQGSLPVNMLLARYAEARRRGAIMGRQVWPEGPNP